MAENFATLYSSTLSGNGGAISSGATSLVVASATNAPAANFRILVENELMLVTAKSSTTYTVTRGIEGTTAVAHSDGAPVTHVLTAAGLAAGYAGLDTANTFSQAQTFTMTASTDATASRFFSPGMTSGQYSELLIGESIATYKAVFIRYVNGAGTAANANVWIGHYGDTYGLGLNVRGGGNVSIGIDTPLSLFDVYGGTQTFSNTTSVQQRAQATLVPSWPTSTDASRKGRLVANAYDTAAREAWRIEADGSAALIGFLGSAAVAQQSVGAAATDAGTTQTLANNLRTALINFGLCKT